MGRRKPRYLFLCSLCFYVIAVANDKVAMYVLCWVTLSLLLVSWTVALLGAGGLRVDRPSPPARLTAGDSLPIGLRIRNDGALAKLNLLLHDQAYNETLERRQRHTSLVPWLPAGHGLRAEAQPMVAQRGRYRLGPAELVTSDPLGLFERRRLMEQTGAEVLVHPRLVRLPGFHPLGLGSEAGRRRRRLSAGIDLRGLREYLPGDDLRFVDWKKSAQFGRLQMREYEALDASEAMVFLDLDVVQVYGDHERSSLESAIEAAGSIALRLRELDVRTRLVAADEQVRTIDLATGADELRLLDYLAVCRPGPAPAVEALRSPAGVPRRGESIIVVSASVDPELPTHLDRLAEAGHGVLWVSLDGPTFTGAAAATATATASRLVLAAGQPLAQALGRGELAA